MAASEIQLEPVFVVQGRQRYLIVVVVEAHRLVVDHDIAGYDGVFPQLDAVGGENGETTRRESHRRQVGAHPRSGLPPASTVSTKEGVATIAKEGTGGLAVVLEGRGAHLRVSVREGTGPGGRIVVAEGRGAQPILSGRNWDFWMPIWTLN